ncbi:FadR/GntR family transcriptional regulator [Mangrovicoccus algicola]|uniref:FadR family transcriptional regulator n=1 Tax=Mangrovicoccus algicola TaxID=2771008 RepID=A0A8J6YY71_9RHOB|nr:FadR/GntR family transcriptional regulator [Mangrovicoccus algicola]MBE3639952.1 FadR family transcriptional regulator [Mangrovicoccus algicola]
MSTRQISPLVSRIITDLKDRISTGECVAGARLPSEAALTATYSVSRTVVREAIAVLRAEGLVEARKGSGVFVLDRPEQGRIPFADLDIDRISSAIELLELRSAVEIRSAGLAAARRSALQLEKLIEGHRLLVGRVARGEPTREADFEFHYLIAESTQNQRFAEFLSVIRQGIVPRTVLGSSAADPVLKAPNPHLVEEHERILDAIVEGDPAAAEQGMQIHLENSLGRYRAFLRGAGA